MVDRLHRVQFYGYDRNNINNYELKNRNDYNMTQSQLSNAATHVAFTKSGWTKTIYIKPYPYDDDNALKPIKCHYGIGIIPRVTKAKKYPPIPLCSTKALQSREKNRSIFNRRM